MYIYMCSAMYLVFTIESITPTANIHFIRIHVLYVGNINSLCGSILHFSHLQFHIFSFPFLLVKSKCIASVNFSVWHDIWGYLKPFGHSFNANTMPYHYKALIWYQFVENAYNRNNCWRNRNYNYSNQKNVINMEFILLYTIDMMLSS